MALLIEMSVLMVIITLICQLLISEGSRVKIQFYTGDDSTDDGIVFKLWNGEEFVMEPGINTSFDEYCDYESIVETNITDLGPLSKVQAWLNGGSDGITLDKIIIHNLDTSQKWHFHPECQLDDNEDDPDECIVASMFPIVIVTKVEMISSVKKIGVNKKVRKGKIIYQKDVISVLQCTELCLQYGECSAFHFTPLDPVYSRCELVAECYRIRLKDFNYSYKTEVYQLN